MILQLDDGIRNLLCIPIYSNDEEVIGNDTSWELHSATCYFRTCGWIKRTCVSLCAVGVAQMANKEKMLPFTSTDQESLEVCNY